MLVVPIFSAIHHDVLVPIFLAIRHDASGANFLSAIHHDVLVPISRPSNTMFLCPVLGSHAIRH